MTGSVGAITPPGRIDTAREAADGDYRMIWGKRCFFGYMVTPEQEIWWYASPPARRPPTPGDPRAADTAALHSGLTRLAEMSWLYEHRIDWSTDRRP